MHIIAVDPGIATGIAEYVNGSVNAWEDPWMTAVDYTEDMHPDVIVVENFIPRVGVALTWQPDALYCIGALKYLSQKQSSEFVLQPPAHAKQFSTNDKLKRIGWYTPTIGGHANDAVRHLLLYAVRHQLVETEGLLARRS